MGDLTSLHAYPRRPRPYGAHAADRGFNALALRDAAHVWVRAVSVLNADNAVLAERVDHASLLGALAAGGGEGAWARLAHCLRVGAPAFLRSASKPAAELRPRLARSRTATHSLPA